MSRTGKVEYSTRYGAAVLVRECARIRTGPYTAAWRLKRAATEVGRYVAGNEIDQHEAERNLRTAARAARVPARNAERIIQEALTVGMREPKSAGDATPSLTADEECCLCRRPIRAGQRVKKWSRTPGRRHVHAECAPKT